MDFKLPTYVLSYREWRWIFWFKIISLRNKHVFYKSSSERLIFLKCGLIVFLSILLVIARSKVQCGWNPAGQYQGSSIQEIQILGQGKENVLSLKNKHITDPERIDNVL